MEQRGGIPGLLLLVAATLCAERLPVKNYTTSDGLAHDITHCVRFDRRGFLWICTEEGLSRFDGYQFTNYSTAQGLPHRRVVDFRETRQGQYWVATSDGVCRF
ncbi:MAG: hypothetical protein HYR60_12745, partial [Acidobacteria bacterium]|nr:hypothetical protein [Acidobacteriota bacterium]